MGRYIARDTNEVTKHSYQNPIRDYPTFFFIECLERYMVYVVTLYKLNKFDMS
jgi:hypothetical protein